MIFARTGDQTGKMAVQIASGGRARNLPDRDGDQQWSKVGAVARLIETNQQWHGEIVRPKGGVRQEVTDEDRVREERMSGWASGGAGA